MPKHKLMGIDAETLLKNNRKLTEVYLSTPPNSEERKAALKKTLEEIAKARRGEKFAHLERGPLRSARRKAEPQEVKGSCEKHGAFTGPRCMQCTDNYLSQLATESRH